MNNQELLIIHNYGVLNITGHSLPAAQAYKLVQFRKEVTAKFKELQESEQALIKEVGIEDGQKFDEELKELRKVGKPNKEQKAKLEEMEGKLNRLGELRTELMKQEITLDCKKMPYEAWHELRNENKEVEVNGKKLDLLPNFLEDLLEGILWEAPKEEEK